MCALTRVSGGGTYTALKLILSPVTHFVFFLSLSVSAAVVQVDGSPVRLQLCDTAGQVSLHTNTLHYHSHSTQVIDIQCLHASRPLLYIILTCWLISRRCLVAVSYAELCRNSF